MKWKAFAGTAIGLTVAATAPIIPTTVPAQMWYATNSACFARYVDETRQYEKEIPCDEYWKTTNTPNYPQPKHTSFHSLLNPLSVSADVAFDTSSNSGIVGGNATSFSWSHTASGSDRTLVVFVGNASDLSISTITYDGSSIAPNLIQNANRASADTVAYYKIAPNTTASTISVTMSGSCTSSNPCFGGAMSFTSTDQTNPIDASNKATGANTDPTVSVTTVTAGALVVDTNSINGSTALTVGASQTQKYNVDGSSDAFQGSIEGPIATPTSVTMNWVGQDGTSAYATVAVAIKPSAATPTTPQDDTYFEIIN